MNMPSMFSPPPVPLVNHHHHHHPLLFNFNTNTMKSSRIYGPLPHRRIRSLSILVRGGLGIDVPPPPPPPLSSSSSSVEVPSLPAQLERERLPTHVAVIMDGNSRWAKGRGEPASAGHEAGCRALKQMVALSCRWGIRVLTVFAFSQDNWGRPKAEVDFLMMLFQDVVKESLGELIREGVRVCMIGDSSKLPKSLQKLAAEVEERTRNNTRLDLVVAISYSGRNDIVQACQNIAKKVKDNLIEPTEINEALIALELETNCIKDYQYPDLLIRTSGELRLSNFLLWESAYTELYFANTHWPEFGEAEYIEALSSFQRRQRRFGLRII